MPIRPPLCPAFSASQALTLCTIPEDAYSPLQPHEAAIFDNFSWTGLIPPISNSNSSEDFDTSQCPNPTDYAFNRKEGIIKVAFSLSKVQANDDDEGDNMPLQIWLQNRVEDSRHRENLEKEACKPARPMEESKRDAVVITSGPESTALYSRKISKVPRPVSELLRSASRGSGTPLKTGKENQDNACNTILAEAGNVSTLSTSGRAESFISLSR